MATGFTGLQPKIQQSGACAGRVWAGQAIATDKPVADTAFVPEFAAMKHRDPGLSSAAGNAADQGQTVPGFSFADLAGLEADLAGC